MTAELRDIGHQYVLTNVSVMKDLYAKWVDEERVNPSCPTFAEWMQSTVRACDLDLTNAEDMDHLLLSRKLSQRAICYARITAFGDHFRVEDETTAKLLSYNSGVASMFQLPPGNVGEASVNYVGVLKDILLLDYGTLHTQIILLWYKWVRHQDGRGNPTYIRDAAGFLVVNFCHKLPRIAKPFIFPSQATQVFFSDVDEKPG